MEKITLAVREVAEFVGRSGSITNQFALTVRALEGTRLHVLYQSTQGDHYQKEYYISHTMVYHDMEITFQGRIDGLYEENDEYYVEELKSTYVPLEEIDQYVSASHYYQGVIYCYLLTKMKQLSIIHLTLVYIQAYNNEIKKIPYTFSREEIEKEFKMIFDQYEFFLLYSLDRKALACHSIEQLEFPYETKRVGQSQMMNAVYYSIKNNNKLFLQASTGLGKTLGVLYPSLKTFAKGYTNKIMYLTAKTITRNVVIETMELLRNKGLKMNTIVINSKDTMCLLEKRSCNPEDCPYANHYFNKVNPALKEALSDYDYFDQDNITDIAIKYEVCPFELSLDLFNFCHLAILDYNYAFDPRVSLQRAFTPDNNPVLLCDEAHNLVDRSRDMYSASLEHASLLAAKQAIELKNKYLYQLLERIEAIFSELSLQSRSTGYVVMSFPPSELIESVSSFFNQAYDYLQKVGKEEDSFVNFFFECSRFRMIIELYDVNYQVYYLDNPMMIKLYCIHPTNLLIEKYKQCQSVIFFSASLLPISYFYNLLGGDENDKRLYFESHFDPNHQLVLIAGDVDTRYHARNQSLPTVAQYVYRFTMQKAGNYLILFPSYDYLRKVYAMVAQTYPDLCIYQQEASMTMPQRQEFLEKFKNHDKTQVFFGILGGLFAEGIDFKGDLLIGCMIVGVGLPQIGLERDLIRDFYGKQGYDYAYKYPGFNKVLQGAGRVIRHEEDYGAIVLVDQRYTTHSYLQMFPREWENLKTTSIDTIECDVAKFWQKVGG